MEASGPISSRARKYRRPDSAGPLATFLPSCLFEVAASLCRGTRRSQITRKAWIAVGVGAAVLAAILALAVVLPSVSNSPEETNSEDHKGMNHGPTPSPSVTTAESPISPGSPEIAGRRNSVTWSGPDTAVSTWFDEECQREVLQFGSQLYLAAGEADDVPPEVTFMDYRTGNKQLWGDRSAPNTLYITDDGGKTFAVFQAVDSAC